MDRVSIPFPFFFVKNHVHSKILAIIFIGAPIDDTIANLVVAQILFCTSETPEKPIRLYINSPGRSVFSTHRRVTRSRSPLPYRTDPLRDKDDPQSWADHYDKIPIERRILNDPNLPGTVLRLPAVYGPGDNQHRLYPTLKRIDDNRPCILFEEKRSRRNCPGNHKRYSSRKDLQHFRTANLYGSRLGTKNRLCHQVERRNSHLPQRSDADSTRIREELGYKEIIPLDEGLEKTIALERGNPPSKIENAR